MTRQLHDSMRLFQLANSSKLCTRAKEMEDGCPQQILTVMPFERKME